MRIWKLVSRRRPTLDAYMGAALAVLALALGFFILVSLTGCCYRCETRSVYEGCEPPRAPHRDFGAAPLAGSGADPV